jgi:hypothetical protein
VSVKDRWVDSCEQVLNILITCQSYGPSKPSSQFSIEGWLCPHCFNGWLGRETGYGPADQLDVVLWIGSGALFSREQWSYSTLLMATRKFAKCGLCEIRMVEDHTWTERGKRVAC